MKRNFRSSNKSILPGYYSISIIYQTAADKISKSTLCDRKIKNNHFEVKLEFTFAIRGYSLVPPRCID